jgi:hypothetical protein
MNLDAVRLIVERVSGGRRVRGLIELGFSLPRRSLGRSIGSESDRADDVRSPSRVQSWWVVDCRKRVDQVLHDAFR